MSKKKNVIIITYHMIPNTLLWGASQRMYYLANYLYDKNFNAKIIHADFGVNNYFDKKIIFSTIPIKIKPEYFQRIQNSFQNKKNDSEQSGNFIKINLSNYFKPMIRYLEKKLFNDFNPFGLIIFLWSVAVKKELQKIVSESQNNVFILSGPYFTYFRLVGWIKKRWPKSKIILDYRDPWNLLKRGSFYTFYKEKRCLNRVDAVTFFSDKFMNDMIKTFKISIEKCHFIYNGYDSDLWEDIDNVSKMEKHMDRLIISYVSSGITFKENSFRDLNNFLEALSGLRKTKKIEVNLVGCIDYPSKVRVDSMNVKINYYGIISQRDANIILKRSHVAIILSSDKMPSVYTLTGKLFDYMRSGCFILGISNNLDIHYCQLIKDLGLGIVCRNNIEEIQKSLDKIIDHFNGNDLIRCNIDNLNYYSRSVQNQKYIDIINALS